MKNAEQAMDLLRFYKPTSTELKRLEENSKRYNEQLRLSGEFHKKKQEIKDKYLRMGGYPHRVSNADSEIISSLEKKEQEALSEAARIKSERALYFDDLQPMLSELESKKVELKSAQVAVKQAESDLIHAENGTDIKVLEEAEHIVKTARFKVRSLERDIKELECKIRDYEPPYRKLAYEAKKAIEAEARQIIGDSIHTALNAARQWKEWSIEVEQLIFNQECGRVHDNVNALNQARSFIEYYSPFKTIISALSEIERKIK